MRSSDWSSDVCSSDLAKLDLVEISADAVPPVCKLMDYGKSIFEKKKQIAAAKKNQKQIQVKEIKFRPGTEEGDYQVKLRNLVRFLSDGDREMGRAACRERVCQDV